MTIVVSIILLVVVGWGLFRSQFSWVSIEEALQFPLTHNEETSTVTLVVNGMFDIVFDTNEPVVNFLGNQLTMRDGVRIRNNRAYINMRDAGIFDQLENILNDISAADTLEPVVVIINGLYGEGTEEQNAMIHNLLGGAQARDRFELYFQWYNTIHELGHAITIHHGTYDPNRMEETRHMVDEEMLVNSFAIAFWMHYGEPEKIYALEEMVDYVLSNLTPPVENISHLDFMRQAINEGRFQEVFTFETYGWFQYSMVRDILHNRDSLNLETLLEEMVGARVEPQPSQTLSFPYLGTNMVPIIVADAVYVLRNWGVHIPDVYIAFDTDPNAHMVQYPVSRAALQSNIEAGRLLPASR